MNDNKRDIFNSASRGEVTVRPLLRHEIPLFLELQTQVCKSLPTGEKHFLKKRTASQLAAHIDAGMPLIGVFDRRGALVAQALLGYPGQHPATVLHTGDYTPLHGREAGTAVVQCVSVDPAWRGQHLMTPILKAAESLAAASGHSRLVAKVAVKNEKSCDGFKFHGFTAAAFNARSKCGNKTYAACFMVKNIDPAETRPVPEITPARPMARAA